MCRRSFQTAAARADPRERLRISSEPVWFSDAIRLVKDCMESGIGADDRAEDVGRVLFAACCQC
jgi:hypothetical protein